MLCGFSDSTLGLKWEDITTTTTTTTTIASFLLL